MLEASYEQVKAWLIQIKEEMDLGNLPDEETPQEVNFNDD